jgi:hypothetical protein
MGEDLGRGALRPSGCPFAGLEGMRSSHRTAGSSVRQVARPSIAENCERGRETGKREGRVFMSGRGAGGGDGDIYLRGRDGLVSGW